jgi:hypothetical protein
MGESLLGIPKYEVINIGGLQLQKGAELLIKFIIIYKIV